MCMVVTCATHTWKHGSMVACICLEMRRVVENVSRTDQTQNQLHILICRENFLEVDLHGLSYDAEQIVDKAEDAKGSSLQ